MFIEATQQNRLAGMEHATPRKPATIPFTGSKDIQTLTNCSCAELLFLALNSSSGFEISKGVRVHYLALGGVDLTSPAGKMTMQVIAAVAEFERDLLLERTQSMLSWAI